MAKVIPIGQPVNDAERKAIALLRDHLPEDWTVIHNFEMRSGKEVFEIDIALIAPHAVYLVDVKGTHGTIDVYGSKWYPEGRQPFISPLAKIRNHAKILHSIIADSNPAITELRKAYVHAAVLLTSDDAILVDQSDRDKPDVTDIKQCLKYFRDTTKVPDNKLHNLSRFNKQIITAIIGKSKPSTGIPVFREWQVEERLGGDDRCTEYRARHSLLGKSSGMARLSVYQTDPYQDKSIRDEELKLITNAYRAVSNMPSHVNILAVRDLFKTDDGDKVVLVTEDVPGQSLRLHINKSSMALTFDQKLQIIRDTLSALDHAHKYEVIHRNITPDSILVTKSGQARLTGFDYARVGKNRTTTIATLIVDELDDAYQAPECFKDPTQASIASDIYSAGIVFFELITSEKPFESIDQMMDADGKFPVKPSEYIQELPEGMDEWLQLFCEFDQEDRYASAAVALKSLEGIILPEAANDNPLPVVQISPALQIKDISDLPQDYILSERFRVQKKLGAGGFGVTYKVFDAFGDVTRVIKMITKDRHSVYERMRREYKALTNLPEHSHVVKVIWADKLNDVEQTPYIVFEYIEGLDVSDMIDADALSIDDSVRILKESAEGLKHLHEHGVFHQDVKPSNLLWTDVGVRIIDFNVSVVSGDDINTGGGTRRYIPPDYNYNIEPDDEDRIDRDIYALGITFYECATGGKYPFDDPTPPINTQPKDIKQFKGCSDLSETLLNLINKMIAPNRADRFASVSDVLTALSAIDTNRKTRTSETLIPQEHSSAGKLWSTEKENYNPFVSYLLTLYSQSNISNAGTRGLDDNGKATYVDTYMDTKLMPAILNGKYDLVIISGNAGDGKTAFIQQFESYAESKGATVHSSANGSVVKYNDHSFLSNYDGSQDEGDERNDEVLHKFFSSFMGADGSSWDGAGTRLIAINEGRLIDFLSEHLDEYEFLSEEVTKGLRGEVIDDRLAVINLNLRAVVKSTQDEKSILERLVLSMTKADYWTACDSCDLKDKCYINHNVRTFQDTKAGSLTLERLVTLFTITHLRGRLHITMRDLRSALSFMIAGTKDCESLHSMYLEGGEDNQNEIMNGFYFNSWLGGESESKDRLISLLSEIDIAEVSNPVLDRELGFLSPTMKKSSRLSFENRGVYDDSILEILFDKLPRDFTVKGRSQLIDRHQRYLAYLRRRHYFECRDDLWKAMLPYKKYEDFINLISKPGCENAQSVDDFISAINRGEGLIDSNRIGNQLALRVRSIEKGTVRSYRVFDGTHFALQIGTDINAHPYVENLPQTTTLCYVASGDAKAQLKINLDIYEMLMRLNSGYRPSIEEEEGFYLSLAIFKNALSSASYQEVLLTENGIEFYRIRRDAVGVLHLEKVENGGLEHGN